MLKHRLIVRLERDYARPQILSDTPSDAKYIRIITDDVQHCVKELLDGNYQRIVIERVPEAKIEDPPQFETAVTVVSLKPSNR